MKWLPAILLILAGCAEPQNPAPSEASEPFDVAGFDWQAPLNFTIGPVAADLFDEPLAFDGTAYGALVEVFFEQDGNVTRVFSQDVNGSFSFSAKPAHGMGAVRVVADNGNESRQVLLNYTQWAPATMQVDYGAGSSNAPVDDLVWVNVDGRASASMYDDVASEHPGYATVHDTMRTWEIATGHVIDYGHSDGLGFSVDKIDGDGNPVSGALPPYWLYTINGESSEFGITLQPFQPGDVVKWCLGTCS